MWVIVPVVIIGVCIVGQIVGFMNFRTEKGWRSAGNIMAPIDGLFAPNRQEALQEQERQTELPAPAPSPGDPLLDLEKGIARIDRGRGHGSRLIEFCGDCKFTPRAGIRQTGIRERAPQPPKLSR